MTVFAPDSLDKTFEVIVMEVEETSVQVLSTAQDYPDEYVSESFRVVERTLRRSEANQMDPRWFTFDSNEHAHPLIWAAPYVIYSGESKCVLDTSLPASCLQNTV